ncbi:MAG: hypothetical protein GY851_18960 [bacterium]|nr:hypothetical protein [bacterium]
MKFVGYTSLVLAVGLLASASIAVGQTADPANLSRGHSWVRNHDFTVNAVCEWPMNLDAYTELGFTSYMFIVNERYYPEILKEVTRLGLDWHAFVGSQDELEWYRRVVPEWREQHPNNIGWNVGDEWPKEKMVELGPLTDAVRELAPDALVYTACRSLDFLIDGKAPTRDQFLGYLDEVIQNGRPDVLHYDLYPFYRGGTGTTFFPTMALVRQKAIEADIPYWGWMQSFGWTDGPFQEPSESEMRFQAYAHLAYGYTGITYWTYASSYKPYTRGFLDVNGDETHMYNTARTLVPELKNLGRVLRFLRSTAVYYQPARVFRNGQWLHPQPPSTVPWTPEADPRIKDVRVSDGPHGFLLGFFKDDAGDDYLMIVNGNHAADTDAQSTAGAITIQFTYAVTELQRVNRTTGEVDPVPLCNHQLNHYVLPGGTGDLFRFPSERPIPGL